MNIRANSPSWFDTLRRDSTLFAVIGAFVLVLNMLQPLAAAGMELDGRWVVCTNGVAPSGGDGVPASDKCPVCVAGHNCAAPASLHKAIAAGSVDVAIPSSQQLSLGFPASAEQVPAQRTGRTPAIRAPPYSA